MLGWVLAMKTNNNQTQTLCIQVLIKSPQILKEAKMKWISCVFLKQGGMNK